MAKSLWSIFEEYKTNGASGQFLDQTKSKRKLSDFKAWRGNGSPEGHTAIHFDPFSPLRPSLAENFSDSITSSFFAKMVKCIAFSKRCHLGDCLEN